jgi:hypothetical protein
VPPETGSGQLEQRCPAEQLLAASTGDSPKASDLQARAIRIDLALVEAHIFHGDSFLPIAAGYKTTFNLVSNGGAAPTR